jgi:RNA polymerase sigma factor (TIGR02999 family)
MGNERPSEITAILNKWNDGDSQAKEELLQFVYDDLRRQARAAMSRERAGHTLQPTALVHEAYLRLKDADGIVWQDRAHFFGIASRLMRQILVDHARKYATAKRGSRPISFSLDDVQIPVEEKAGSLVELDHCLERLSALDERQAAIVEMRFFGGMSNGEIATTLDISERTVGREWNAARLWLFRELSRT